MRNEHVFLRPFSQWTFTAQEVRKTHAFNCRRGQTVYARQILVELTAPVYDILRVEVIQASCGTTQLNRAK